MNTPPIISGIGKVTKRFVVSLLGCLMVWYFLNTHRAWVWVYFDSMMRIDHPDPALAAVAEKSIAAITTIAITGITSISAIVVWFVTGNVMAMQSMFKFSSIGQASASVTSDTVSQIASERREEKITTEHIEHVVVEGEPGAPARRPFTPIEDES